MLRVMTLVFSALTSLGWSQPTPAQEKAARAFAERLGYHEPLTAISSGLTADPNEHTWQGNGYTLRLYKDQPLQWMSTLRRTDKRSQPALAIIKTEDQAWNLAEEWLDDHHVAHGIRLHSFLMEPPYFQATVSWIDQPNGYPVSETFQYLEARVDTATGVVGSVLFPREFGYMAPHIKISESEAERAFIEKVRDFYGIDPTDVEGIGLFYRQPYYATFGGRPLVDVPPSEQTLRLCYGYRGKIALKSEHRRIFASIDAETGEVVSGGMASNEFPSSDQLRPRRMAQARTIIARWATGVAVALACALCLLSLRGRFARRTPRMSS